MNAIYLVVDQFGNDYFQGTKVECEEKAAQMNAATKDHNNSLNSIGLVVQNAEYDDRSYYIELFEVEE